MNSKTKSPDENVPRGRLELSNKTYTVYDGLNTVGRNPGAVVNIKNLNISHQHAIITIVDRNTHFISDFKSSNGTTLNNKKLQPLKLYKLNHGASIKFADVHCTYKKLENNEEVFDNWEATQNFSESFYSTNTQTIHLNNSNELNINEMPTQTFMPPPPSFNDLPSSTLSINELPTQVQVCLDDSDLDNHDNVLGEAKNGSKTSDSNKSRASVCNIEEPASDIPPPLSGNEMPSTALSINELPTQVYNLDDSKFNNCQDLNSKSDDSNNKSSSQALDTDKPVQGNTSNVLEESRNDSSNDSIDFMTMQKVTESQAVGLGNEDKADVPSKVTLNQTDSELGAISLQSVIQPVKLNSSKNVLSTDSEGEQSTPEVRQPSAQGDTNEQPVLSQICPVKISKKQVIGSDSEDSDTEEYIPPKERRKSKYVISDDSETDIEDTGDNKCNNTTLNDTDVVPSTQEVMSCKSETLNTSEPLEHSSMNSFRLEISELADDNVEEPKVEQEPVAGTSLKDVIAEDHIYCSKPNSQQTEEPVKSNSMEDHIYCRSPDDETEKPVEQNSDQPTKENVNDQLVEAQTKGKDDAEISGVKSVEKDDKPQSQEPAISVQKESESEAKFEKKMTEGVSQQRDEDETLSIIGDGDSNPLTEDFISTNIQKEEEKNLDEEKVSSHLSPIGVEKSDKDEEKLSSHQSPNEAEKSDKEENKQDDQDIFEQSTQQCDLDFVSDKKKINYKSDDDVFLQPTQKMIGGSEKDEIDDDIYIQSTQPINHDDKKTKASGTSDEDVYFQPTQQLVTPVETNREKSPAKDHEFARPFQRFGAEKASTSKKIEDDDDLLPPTQALEILHKEDKSDQQENLSNQSSNSSEVEDQMEMMFYSQSDERFNATQQLVDVLEDNDDIIEDSMLEENRGTPKRPEFSTNDSIRMILDDFEDDSDKAEKNVKRNDKRSSERIVDKKDKDESNDPNNKFKDTGECSVSDKKLKNNETRSKNQDENQLKEELKNKNNSPNKISNDQKTEEVAEKSQEHKDEVFDANTSKKLIEDTNKRKIEKKGSQGSTDEIKTKTRGKVRNDKANEETSGSTSSEGELIISNASTNVSKDKAVRKTEKNKSQKNTDEMDDNGTRTRRKARNDKENEETGSSASNESEVAVTNTSTNVSKDKTGRKTTKKNSQDSTDETEVSATRTRRNLRNVVLENLDEINEEASSSTRETPRKKTLKRSNTEDENKNMTELQTKEQGSISRTRTKKGKTIDNSEGSVNLSETSSVSKVSTRKGIKESDNDVEEDILRKKQDSKVRKEENARTTRKREGSVVSNSSDKNEKIEENDKVRTRRKRGEKKEDNEVGKTEDNDEQLVSIARKRTLKSSTLTITDFKDKDRSKDLKTLSEIENTPMTRSTRTRQMREGSVASDVSDGINQPSTSTASTRKRQMREGSVASDVSDGINQPSTSTASTRKRNLKITEHDSEDDFEPSPGISSPKKKKVTTPQVVETPTIRKSKRARKPKLFNDEVVSVSSVSSQDEPISCSSTSTVNEQPPKKTRRLSANSRALKNEQVSNVKEKQVSNQNASVLATPERSKRQLKPKVVFTMMDSPELESLIRQLGGSVVDTVDACTVLVTESVKRSQKLLCAVGQSKPICSPSWLQACKKAHTFLDPSDYILVDREAEQKWNFSLQESLRRSAGTKLLENHTFQIVVNTAADVLKGAIEACGGKCVTRNLAKADTDYKYIVSDKDCKAKYTKIVKANPGIEVVEKEAIFDGTLRQEFRFNDYLIT